MCACVCVRAYAYVLRVVHVQVEVPESLGKKNNLLFRVAPFRFF